MDYSTERELSFPDKPDALSFLAQTVSFFDFSVITTYCASVRGKKVTLRMGRKGESNEETYDTGSCTQHYERLLGWFWSRSIV
jgi:hypothetical protein